MVVTYHNLQVHFFAILGILYFAIPICERNDQSFDQQTHIFFQEKYCKLRTLQAGKTFVLCVQNLAFLCQPAKIPNISTHKE